MKKKLLLLALVGTTTLTTLVVAGLALSNANSFSIAAGSGLVEHSLVMTTGNTTVSIEDDTYLYMDTYTTRGNKFSAYHSEIETDSTVHCNTDDALFEVSEIDETINLYFNIGFDFNLDVEVGGELAKNITACLYYKEKTGAGWDEEPQMLDWDGLDAEGNHALFTFQNNFGGVYGFKLISCNFTYPCSY